MKTGDRSKVVIITLQQTIRLTLTDAKTVT